MNLSIIIPVYNGENHIKNCLVSINEQTYQTNEKIEVIVINDGSTDATEQVVKEIKKNLVNLELKLITTDNKGVSHARNIGIKHARKDYVHFLDADDYLDENFLFHTIRQINKADIVTFGFDNVDRRGNVLKSFFKRYNTALSLTPGTALLNQIIEKKYSIWVASAIYSKEYLFANDIWFPEGCHSGEDNEFIYKSLMGNGNIQIINQVLVYYVQHEEAFTKTPSYKMFDTIASKDRLIAYAEERFKKKKLKTFINHFRSLKNERYLGYFMLIYQSSEKKPFVSVHKIKNNINYYYGNTVNEMRSSLLSIKSKTFRTIIRHYLFLISPYIFLKTRQFYRILYQTYRKNS